MGRQKKSRFVTIQPKSTVFKPRGVPMSQLQGVRLPLDGLEAMRLVDAEGLTQQNAAEQMHVSRPTLCRILGDARMQVARALSNGWAIRSIEAEAHDDETDTESEEFCTRTRRRCGRQTIIQET